MICVQCGKDIKDEDVCCSYASYDDGTHDDPVCIECHRDVHPKSPIWEGKSVAGGTYERCDCDT
jgi:hypothetical protein